MKKNKSNLIILLLIIVGLTGILGFFLWRENILDIFKPYPYAMTRLEGYPRVVENSKTHERDRKVINNKEEFDAFVNQYFDNPSEVPMPEINFETERLVVAITENNPTLGYSIKVKSALKDESEEEKVIRTIIQITEPGKTCVNDAIPNTAVEMVKVERNEFEVDFEREIKTVECN